MARRAALLVATYDYQDAGLGRLAAPGHDAEALAAVLRNPRIADFEVSILVNEPHHVVGRAIGNFFRERCRDDLTVLYFSGHGVKDADGHLYLAMTDTLRDDLVFTAVSAQQVDYAMESSLSRQKVLILDCCYGGAFPAGWRPKTGLKVHSLENFQGKGRVVLTASDATQFAFEGDRLRGQVSRSVFTRWLVEGLITGKADLDGDGDISLDELYQYVYDHVVEEMPRQRPMKHEDVVGRLVIARNIQRQPQAEMSQEPKRPGPGTGGQNRSIIALARSILRGLRDGWVPSRHARRLTVVAVASLMLAISMIAVYSIFLDRSLGVVNIPVLSNPAQGAIALRGREVYIPNQNDKSVSVIDTVSNKVSATIAVDSNPDMAAAAPPDGRYVYIANGGSRTVSVIDAASNFVIATPSVGRDPNEVVLDGRYAYVCNHDSGTVSIIDTTSNTVVATIPVGSEPGWGVATRDGAHVYISNWGSNTVSVIDTASNTVIANIPVGTHPDKGVMTPNGRYVYISNWDSGTVSVIDTVSNAVIANIPVGAYPGWGAAGPYGRYVYIPSAGSHHVSVIDTESNKVVAIPAVGNNPHAAAVAPNGRHVYITNYGSGTVSVIDTTSNKVTANIPVHGAPFGIVVTQDGHVYISNTYSGDVSVIAPDAIA